MPPPWRSSCARAGFPEDFTLYWAMLASLVTGTGRWMVDASFDKRRLDGLTLGLHRMFLRRLPQLPKALWRLHRGARHRLAHGKEQ